jgi:hypothetical protein
MSACELKKTGALADEVAPVLKCDSVRWSGKLIRDLVASQCRRGTRM